VFTEEGLIYMVQEYGEIDLARLLAKHDAARRAAAGVDLAKGGLLQDSLDENFIRLYWQQMLHVSITAALRANFCRAVSAERDSMSLTPVLMIS
jgi:serine/threonine-protein kinase TTK/MPS1